MANLLRTNKIRQLIQSSNALRNFSSEVRHSRSATHQSSKLTEMNFDHTQVEQMKDMITLVDENDNVVGPISKLNAHFKTEEALAANPRKLPHRAFSLFLFNERNELLMQLRSKKKITFPDKWTNTCCSHNGHIPEELESENNYIGMRRAAVRRAEFELGITELNPEKDLHVGSRILYYADNCDKFAEHELDYIVFSKKELEKWEPEKHVNRDEVDGVEWVNRRDFKEFLEFKLNHENSDITPWFRLLIESGKLMKWWQLLEDKNTFPQEADRIERFI